MKYSPENYINRELSWLEFNQRVLDLAEFDEVPLLERVKFLAITGSNLDEFYKVRVGGLMLASSVGSDQKEISGLTINEQLDAVQLRVRKMYEDQSSILSESLLPQLAEHGIRMLKSEQLTEEQSELLGDVFRNEIASAIAPIAVRPRQPFPLLAGTKLCLCFRLKLDSRTLGDVEFDKVGERFVVVPIGGAISRLVSLPDESGFPFMLVEDVIEMFSGQLFPGQRVIECVAFRISRNADIALNDDGMHDLLKEMSEMLEQRKVSQIIRLEVAEKVTDSMLKFLQAQTGVSDVETYKVDGPLDLSAMFELASIQGFSHLKDEPWPPQPSPDFAEGSDIFETIAAADRLLLQPYQSFDPIVNFVRAAAADSKVIAIKQTLYRTSTNSEVIKALIQAAENGKQVTAIVELKARFDEAQNIGGARILEQAGIDVIYGVRGLKTHAKVCIVVRRETRGIQRYVHFGTGNYNESTAKLYSDVSYFTNNEQLGSDAIIFFNAITGLSVPQPLQKLAAAPIDLKETLLDLIYAQCENAKSGGVCEINAKLNSLVDRSIIDALYAASKAGVTIRLNVRGICCLKPGVPKLSENIEVISIVDRVLEHARIFHFNRGGDELVYISSADWMGRNLNRRAELLVPVVDKACKRRLLNIMESYFKDNVRAMKLNSKGKYKSRSKRKQTDFRSQEYLYQEACDLYSAFVDPKATVFTAIRGESA